MWGLGGIILSSIVGGIAVGVAAVWSVALWVVDTRERRLPDALTLPAAAVTLIYTLAAEPASLVGLVWPVLYVLVGLLQGGVGGGDVKLAVSLGLLATLCSGLVGLAVAMMLASVVTVAAAVVSGQRTVPHGPGMLVGAWTAVISAVLFAQ